MAGSQSSGQGGSPTVITSVQPPSKPLNLLDAVSEIQQMSALEKNMEQSLDKNFLTTKQRIDFFAVGTRNAFLHFFFTLFITPFIVAVFHHLIHIFGDSNLTIFDEVYAIILAFSLSLGFGFFLATLRECYVGTITKGMVNSLFSGLAFGETVKAALAAIIYSFIYISMTPAVIASFIIFMNKHFASILLKLHVNYTSMYYWLIQFRDVFPVAAVFILISSILMIGIPIVALFFSTWRLRQHKDID